MTNNLIHTCEGLGVILDESTAEPALVVFAMFAASLHETGVIMEEYDRQFEILTKRIDLLEAQLAAVRTDGN